MVHAGFDAKITVKGFANKRFPIHGKSYSKLSTQTFHQLFKKKKKKKKIAIALK